jgi:hypothetical protein
MRAWLALLLLGCGHPSGPRITCPAPDRDGFVHYPGATVVLHDQTTMGPGFDHVLLRERTDAALADVKRFYQACPPRDQGTRRKPLHHELKLERQDDHTYISDIFGPF